MTLSALDRLEAAIGDDGPITREQQRDLVADLIAVRSRLPFHCPTCIQDFREPFCPACGLHLTLDKEGNHAA